MSERADHKTRFSSTNQPVRTGRPAGTRDKISSGFLSDLADIWQRRGMEVLERVANEHPDKLASIVASLEAKRVEITKTPEEQRTDEEIDALYAKLLAQIPAPTNETQPPVN